MLHNGGGVEPTNTAASLGISLSPGGLLLPYHLGVLDALEYYNLLDRSTPIAGSSAGAIAVTSKACDLDSRKVVESTIAISDACQAMGRARGRLLPLLRQQLDSTIGDAEFATLQDRPGAVGLAYKEILPRYRPVVQTQFADQMDLVNAVCHSSMFPFFASRWPCAVDTRGRRIPRLVVDGFFTVPRDRFGCPDFAMANVTVDREILVCPFPQERIRLDAVDVSNCISPSTEYDSGQMGRLFRLATEPSSREELVELYDSGFADAERWRYDHLGEESQLLN